MVHLNGMRISLFIFNNFCNENKSRFLRRALWVKPSIVCELNTWQYLSGIQLSSVWLHRCTLYSHQHFGLHLLSTYPSVDIKCQKLLLIKLFYFCLVFMFTAGWLGKFCLYMTTSQCPHCLLLVSVMCLTWEQNDQWGIWDIFSFLSLSLNTNFMLYGLL